jgi:bifunctional non-homologous end joining protein LigD
MSPDRYRAKRDPARTPEPVPAEDLPSRDHTGDDQEGRGDRFVIQEHHATALHWDVRLQRDGVLVSWAVPKGIPLDPATNHLAKQTEDHPDEYATFSGDIPKGEYGGGRMSIWDSGTYELEKWSDREVKIVFHGGVTEGRYVFFRTGRQDWMLHRMDPAPAGWTPLPADLRPMRARSGAMPADAAKWRYEVAWDGVRVLVAVDGGRLTITDAEGKNVTASYPDFRGLGLQLGSRQVLLDGEIVAFGPDGGIDPERLESRVQTEKPKPSMVKRTPVQLMLADVLHLAGSPLLDETYLKRRAALEELAVDGEQWHVVDSFSGDGNAILQAARAQGLHGILAKRADSTYRPGKSGADWLLVARARKPR